MPIKRAGGIGIPPAFFFFDKTDIRPHFIDRYYHGGSAPEEFVRSFGNLDL